MSILKKEPTLSEVEEQSVREDALIDLKKKQLIRKEIEQRLGKGGMTLFKAKGDSQENVFKKAFGWLKSH